VLRDFVVAAGARLAVLGYLSLMAQRAGVIEPEPNPRRVGGEDAIVQMRNATWADYQRMLEIRGEKAVPRLTYLEGVLEFMTLSQSHEVIKSMIGCLVEAWCIENGVGITPYGSWTLASKESDRGAEPDECYVLGDIAKPERGDLALAIEVVWTSGGINKLDVYRKLGVREVWIWKDERIDVFCLRGEQYEPVPRSEALPALDLGLLLRFVPVRPMTRAVTEYREALRAAK
jgi:Uma2 family endonuclease